ncbi:amino acid kinase [Thiohalorhabdus methylotrophus]|uniref:Amino acid kinase n=1 Tax=Thiohalorhabdus methylotrophus TaxID=3242694 RepID=A0ABV4TW34_9GAMM
MWVIKVGGSLYDKPSLGAWLDQLACYGSGQVVIVPGGGPFADQVRSAQRDWGFPDSMAHRMAMQAMDQFGHMMIGLRPDLVAANSLGEIREVLSRGQVPVWMAGRDAAGTQVPASWDITSDSLAAHLAGRLEAGRLLLVKSASSGDGPKSARTLCREGLVDPAFMHFLTEGVFSAWVAEEGDYDQLRDMLYAGVPLGVQVVLSLNGAAEA